jgi:hypothetical protein
MVCRLGEAVPGLMAWLTICHHRASTGRHWRGGVFLRHPVAAYASEALLELRTPTELAVDVRAPSPDYFYNVLRDSIEDLMTRRWPGLRYTLHIPCPGRAADGSPCYDPIPVDGLLARRAAGDTHDRCLRCRTELDVSMLLTGFSYPRLSLRPELDRLHAEVAEVAQVAEVAEVAGVAGVRSRVNELKAGAADAADVIRRILRAVTTEATDCPRLFTLTPADPSSFQRPGLDQGHYRLVLWCEHPGHWHPWPAATYAIEQPAVLRIARYAALVFTALRLVAAIALSVTGVILTPDELQQAQNQIELMTRLIAALPSQQTDDQPDLATPGSAHQLTLAQAQAWSVVRSLILEHDPGRAFAGLRRVRAPSGEFLWVCPRDHLDYDPGLPSIPAS